MSPNIGIRVTVSAYSLKELEELEIIKILMEVNEKEWEMIQMEDEFFYNKINLDAMMPRNAKGGVTNIYIYLLFLFPYFFQKKYCKRRQIPLYVS